MGVTNAAKQEIAVCDKVVRNINLFIPLYQIEVADAELFVMDNLTDRSYTIGFDCLRPIRKRLAIPDPIYLHTVVIKSEIVDENTKKQENTMSWFMLLIIPYINVAYLMIKSFLIIRKHLSLSL